MPRYELSINGAKHAVEAPPDMPLLWVIRDLVGLTGTKFGCGIAECRACTVHLDGDPVPSCQIPVTDAVGKKIATIEGVGAKSLHVVQEAWIAEDVPQCGYCQPGQIMSAVALLAKHPSPTDAEIDEGMSGNICRCGTYNFIRRAIHRAAKEMAK